MDMAEFVAKIMADIDDFERDIKKAMAMAKSLDDDVVVDIEANINDFKRDLLKAEALAKQFSQDDIDIELNLQRANFEDDLQIALSNLESELTDDFEIKLDLQAAEFESQLDELRADLENDLEIEVELINAKFNAELAALNARIQKFESDDIEKEVKLKTNKFMAAWRQIQSANDKFSNDMDELANSIRSFGTVGANVIKGSLLSSFTALVPIIASLVPAIMAVGNALAVVGGGAIGLIGVFAVLQTGAYAFGFMAASAIKMLQDGLIQATSATEAYQSALDGLKSKWQEIVTVNADGIFTTMANGMNTAKVALEGLTPFLSGVVTAMQNASSEMLKWAQTSATAQKFFEMMGTTGVSVFENVISAIGRFGNGFLNLINQLAPLFEWVGKGLLNMGTQFDAWSQKVSTAQGIQNFIAYVQENLPKIGEIFGNTFEGIFNLFKAFAPNSQTIFDSLVQMSAKFAEWSATIAQSDGFQKFIEYVQTNGPTIMNLIGSIVMALVNFGIAVAPLGQAVLQLVTAFTQWLAKLFETHPIVAQVVAVVITMLGIFMQIAPIILMLKSTFTELLIPLMNFMRTSALVTNVLKLLGIAFVGISWPVLAVIAVIGTLIAIFVHLWQTNEDFRIKVTEIWNQIKEYISMAIQAVVDFVMQIWGTLVSWWNENNDLIMQTATRIWNTILTVIQVAMAIIVPIVQTAWELIKAAIQIAVDLILGIVKAGMQLLNGDWSGAWQTVKETVSTIWDSIMTAISNIIGIILPIISNFVQNAYQWISEKFNAAKDAVAQALSNMINAIIDWASQTISNVIDAMSNFVSEIVSGGSEALSSLTGALGDMVSAVGGFVGDMVSAGADLIRGMIDGIKNMAGDLVSAATGVVGDAIDGAKSLLGIASPSKVFREIGAFTSEGMAIGITDNARMAVASVTEMAKEMIDAYNPDFASVNASMNKDLGSLNKDLRNTVDADISSGVDVARPVVNVAVHNEGDAEMIRSYVNTEDAIDESLAF